MKKDIESKADIELLVNSFYDKVKVDPVIGPFFTELVKINWDKHLPVMYSFWENTLFFTGSYSGNPMKMHQKLNDIFHLDAKHFDRWVKLFTTNVDELFAGEKAELAKQRARSIATVMQIKFSSGAG